jgi:hypothetical protein
MLSNIGAKPQDIDAMGGQSQMLGDFMQHALKGGNAFSMLSNASANLPGYMNQLRDYQQNINSNSTNGQISPFAATLEDQIGDKAGMARLLASLQAPGLGGLAQPWANALQGSLSGANQRMLTDFGNAPAGTQPPSFMDYIFGKG